MKKNAILALTITLAAFSCQCFAQTNEIEGAAWHNVNIFQIDSLAGFIKSFPDGVHIKDAKALLLIQQRIAAYREKKDKPQFIISFEQMGSRWKDSKKYSPSKGIIGFRFAMTSNFSGFSLRADSQIANMYPYGPFDQSFEMIIGSRNALALPTGDGSIIAFHTNGINTRSAVDDWFFGGFHFVTPKINTETNDIDGTAFFAVVEGLGLVHVFGDVTVISPSVTSQSSGNEIVIKENGN